MTISAYQKAPVGITLNDISYHGPCRAKLYAKLSELELNSFIAKLGLTGEEEENEDKPEVNEEPSVSFKELDSKALNSLKCDTPAVELTENALYVSTECDNYVFRGCLSELSPFFEGKSIICYGGKALLHRLWREGINVRSIKLLDLELYEYVINPGSGSAGIPSLGAMFLSISIPKDAPTAPLMKRLEGVLRKRVEDDGLAFILDSLELPLIGVLTEMEEVGFKIDSEKILEFGEALGELADELAKEIYIKAGEEFNINSPKQLAQILYDKLGLVSTAKGKASRSTDAQTLEELRELSPRIDDILEYRQVTKLKGTYTTTLVEAADENNRIHTDFKQALTATGRLSSADPNLQNIPIKTRMGREMRRFFIAEEGYTLVDADYSQIELRILAHISDDYNMQQAFINNEDIHRKTAAAVFGVPEEYVTEEMRKKAKAVNFGIVYGIGGYSLSKDINTTVAEATRYIKNYLMNYPFIDAYLEDVVREATEKGYTTTPMGRRRYIPELTAAKAPLRAFGKRVAMNAPIQGAAADVMKLAMIRVRDRLQKEGLDARLVMQVHDEIIVEAKDEIAEVVMRVVKEEMEDAVKLSVPLIAEVTMGKNWLEQE